MNQIGLLIILIQLSYCSSQTQYCATIDADEAAGATGYVALQVNDGVAKYGFQLDLTNYQSDCTLENGITFHVHSYWNNDTTASSSDEYCGMSYTGNHYDPNLACSPASQSVADLCEDISRTQSQGYDYNCSSTNYELGRYSYCEVGDISGKYGTILPSNDDNTKFSLDYFEDFLPVYTSNYNNDNGNSLMWSSWVFHCADTGARLVCAKFSDSELDSCSSKLSSGSFSSDSSKKCSDDDDENANLGVMIGVTIVIFLVLLSIGAATGYFARGYFTKRTELPSTRSFDSHNAIHSAY